ncbi:adrenocortical dysplasia protein homolog [Micropterus dolomieu]|uniref:adrenocortical dysplasia protein homolog n=1 Tax=Micropterus dolomieu TaxID=147949 RepID=UPI001E8EECBB|nr:adrenocortical dysplasia protein homolog [Micropterus dolomieu]XP_045892978.1 adrenocortical dysplasia protein homolog [Micropterus dolomieu]XP_045892979.1 adrenocortical dysplasia protein homolog [Micropterus dolomieu]XP_045892980.1 adrenocortical dysplasia protein homolog [Micropterus dolomieu]
MPRPSWSRLSPWIESLILSYGSREGSSSGRLKAHVIGVGQMSQSQAQGSEGPTGLLFLSDGVLQIPAILTAAAWEHLQEQEDRECFTSLLNTTVCIQDYRLQFHMAHEQTKCRFFISVGELATTAAGPIKDNTPCCTTLPSIRMKIYTTWRALLGQEVQDSQKGQCGYDLSELLGEWQHDCLQAVLEDVRVRLKMASSRPVSPQPSTSTSTSSLTHQDTFSATSWDVDRVRYKGVKGFSVPLKCLLIPEEDAQQLQTPPNVGSRTLSGLSASSQDRKKPSETTQPSVDAAEWRIAKPAFVETDHDVSENSPLPAEDSMLHEDVVEGMIDSDIRPLSNPWDMFPPCDISSSDASPEATPKHDDAAVLTSTQLLARSLKESLLTSEHSYLPPYQKLPHSTSLPAITSSSTSVSPPEPCARPSNLLPATDEHPNKTAQQNLALGQESQILEETVERKYRKAKRKRSEPTTEALKTLAEEEDEEAQISGSPPSWLFDTQAGSGAEEGSGHKQVQTVETVLRRTPTVHSDGRPFSYSYQVSGQNLQDFSQFKVAESLLQWAVKYLVVPKQTDNPHITSVTSNYTSSDRVEVTSL